MQFPGGLPLGHTRRVSYKDYSIPDDADDAEAAALEMIVSRGLQQADKVFTARGGDWNPEPLKLGLERFAAALKAEKAFMGLTWHDARIAAAAILQDIFLEKDQGSALLARSHAAIASNDGIEWADRGQAGQVFKAAAKAYPMVFHDQTPPGSK